LPRKWRSCMPTKPSSNGEVLVIGIGNEYASDDAAGLLVARELKERARGAIAVLEHSGEGASLIEAWKTATLVIVIDAVRSDAAPGQTYRFDTALAPLPAEPFRGSTHAFGLLEAIELARSLNQLPRALVVHGIVGRNFAAGLGVSPEVRQAVIAVAESVFEEIKALQWHPGLEVDGCTNSL
jgi:hydrogenase maturation protease